MKKHSPSTATYDASARKTFHSALCHLLQVEFPGLRRVMRSCGALSLTADALTKVQEGITSVDEVLQMRWL